MENNIPETEKKDVIEKIEKRVSSLPPRKTIILIIALILITIGLVYLSISATPQITQKLTETEKNELTYAQTTFTMSEPELVTSENNTSREKVDILINPGENKVSAIQLDITYDPLLLQNMEVVNGELAENLVILTKKVDSQNGNISIALGIAPGENPITKSGVILSLEFLRNRYADEKMTKISFSGQTNATALGQTKPVLKDATGIEFNIKPSPTETPITTE